ncbi:MAG: hypothetical protein PHU03_06010, partial [Syntrophales bacterium]|nr:hypothetical protein [Syntrophales bacterium]
MKKKIMRSVALAAVAIVLILLLGMAGFSLLLESDRGRLLLQSTANRSIQGSVFWSDERYSLWRGEIELREAVLRSAEGDDIAGFDR